MAEKALKGLHASIDLVIKDPARKDYALKAVAVHGRALQFLTPQLRADKEVVSKALSDGWALQWADQECRKDKELVLKAVKKDVGSLQFAPQELLSNKDFAMEAIQINGLSYEFLSPELKLDRQVARAAVTQDGSALEYFPEELKKDRELVYKALQQKGTALEFASAFWDDKMLVTAAVKNDPAAFQWASQELRADRDLWLQACPKRMEHWKNRVEVQKEVQEEGTVLSMADPLVLKDEEVIFEAAVQNPRVLECLDLDRSEDFLLRLARQDLNALRYADIQSREVAQKALEISGLALEFFPEELKADKELVLEAVGRAGMALAFAAPELRNDREVVLRAVAADRSALLHASPELRRDKAIWLYKGAAVPFFEPPKEEEEVEEVNDPAEGEETAVEAAEGQVAEEV